MLPIPASWRRRLGGIRILQPLRGRDYALLTAGSTISLLGDGFFFVALAWQALVLSAIGAALFELGQMIWTTMLQQLVPRELLGRVSSLDWLVSVGLVPVSFALTGPVAGAIGPEWTMVAAGSVGSVLMGALLFAPGVRDPERMPRAEARA